VGIVVAKIKIELTTEYNRNDLLVTVSMVEDARIDLKINTELKI